MSTSVGPAALSVPVLDHGYVTAIESWGSDQTIIESARMSTSGSFRGWDQDQRLLRYLWEHKHATPFEFAGLTVEVQAPIFVIREWMRHRTQSYSEASARYTPLPDLYYVPTLERVTATHGTSKQAGPAAGAEALHTNAAAGFILSLEAVYAQCEELYQYALKSGVPKELARLVMPVGHYSRMRASAKLRNWLEFLSLRLGADVQAETRAYAEAVATIVAERFPRTYQLFAASKQP